MGKSTAFMGSKFWEQVGYDQAIPALVFLAVFAVAVCYDAWLSGCGG